MDRLFKIYELSTLLRYSSASKITYFIVIPKRKDKNLTNILFLNKN